MAQDYNDIYSIVDRLRVLEEGLDKNQRSVNQLSATFKPKTVAVLTAKKDPKNPMAGKLVGGCEESEELDETAMAEDVLDKVKKSFNDFIKTVTDEIEDSDIKEKKTEDSDLKDKDTKDQDLVAKESVPVKTFEMAPGRVCEIHGNDKDGFEIHHAGRAMPTKFKQLDHAETALQMFRNRRARPTAAPDQDYVEER
jgi:hypothetical protein